MADHDTTHAADAHAAGEGEQHSHKSTYITIWLVLALLTAVEIFVPEVYSAPWNQQTKMLLLVGLAVAKAVLVGLYFMHLKWEKPWVKWIAMMPGYMAIFTILLMLETVFRGPQGG